MHLLKGGFKMANHDFNSPCCCSECCTNEYQVYCPNCSLLHIFDVVMSYRDGSEKGIFYYDFFTPDEAGKDFKCSCGYTMTDLNYYTNYNMELTKSRRNYLDKKAKARKCTTCNKIEGFDHLHYGWSTVKLTEVDQSLLCQKCYSKYYLTTLTDPTTDTERYIYNPQKLQYELSKIKIICNICHKPRWLNPENHWKKQCGNCYKKQPIKKKITIRPF